MVALEPSHRRKEKKKRTGTADEPPSLEGFRRGSCFATHEAEPPRPPLQPGPAGVGRKFDGRLPRPAPDFKEGHGSPCRGAGLEAPLASVARLAGRVGSRNGLVLDVVFARTFEAPSLPCATQGRRRFRMTCHDHIETTESVSPQTSAKGQTL